MNKHIPDFQKAAILLLLIVTGQFLRAQDPAISYTLNTTETATKNYTARDEVRMLPGFSFSAGGGNTFKANIDAGLLFPPTENTYALPNGQITNDPAQGAVVGSIPGNASVSPTGAAMYQIPIEIPSGINSMQPQISVIYNSQGGFGALGVGWDISGISLISRTSQNLYYDEVNGKIESNSIKFDNSDRLSLDGQRLLQLSDTHFEVNSEYATQIEDYSLVKIKTSSITGTIYFEISTKEGKLLEFGSTTNSLLKNTKNTNDNRVLSWKLNKITDVFGNYIEYIYTDNGQNISQIKYTGTTSSNPSKSVYFYYETNTINPKVFHFSDFQVIQSKTLTDIVTYSNTMELKRYHFSYDNENRLKDITLHAENNEKMNPTTISWGLENIIQENNVAEMSVHQIPIYSDDLHSVEELYMSDVNGDGFKDCIEIWRSIEFYYSQRRYLVIHLYDKATGSFSNNNGSDKQYIKIIYNYNNGLELYSKLRIADIDNDGVNEIILIEDEYVKVYKFVYLSGIMTLLELSSTFHECNIYKNFWGNYVLGSAEHVTEIFDENNDGYNDLLLVPRLSDYEGTNRFNKKREIFYGSATGFTRGTPTKINLLPWENKYQYGDFNADKKIDFVEFPSSGSNEVFFNNEFSLSKSSTWGQYISNRAKYFTADFNNDGLSDILVQSNVSYQWQLVINNGNTTTSPTIQSQNIQNASNVIFGERYEGYVLDYNGDGLLDFILADESSFNNSFDKTTWYFYKNSNGQFGLEKTFNTTWRIPFSPAIVADLNYDGVDDLVFEKESNYIIFTKPNASKKNLVHSINNGLSVNQSFEYTNYIKYNHVASNNSIRSLQMPLTIVRTFTDIDESISEYEFQDGKFHSKANGFLGFTRIIAKNEIRNSKIISDFQIEPEYLTVSLIKQVNSTYNDDTISTLVQISDIKVIDVIRKRFIPVLISKTDVDYLKKITSISENLSFDYYWNITSNKVTNGSHSIITNSSFKSRLTGGVSYLPESTTVTEIENSDSYSRTTLFDYYPNGILKKTTGDPENENKVLTQHEYDSFGNLTQITVTANEQELKSLFSYTGSGYFLATKTNNLNETTTYSWDENRGLLLSESDHWNRVTTYKYNLWGQLEETVFPDGIRSANKLQWADNNNIFLAKYYIYSEKSGSPPVWVWYNAKGQNVCKQTKGLNSKITMFSEYYPDGKLQHISEPTFDINQKNWEITYTYDNYGRIETVNSTNGWSTYTYNGKSTTIQTPEETRKIIKNDLGQTICSIINDKSVNYTYYPSGLLESSTPDNGQSIKLYYDLQGNRIKLEDPDAGVVESKYDGFGKLLWYKQKVHDPNQFVMTTYNYNISSGLLQSIVREGSITETKTYTYDTDHGHQSRIKSVQTDNNEQKQTYTYDANDQITDLTEQIGGRTFNRKTEYDALGRVWKETYPSGYYTQNSYDKDNGFLTEVKDKNGSQLWKAVSENARGQLTQVLRGGKTSIFGFNSKGFPTTILTSGIIDLSYNLADNGNLNYRQDNTDSLNIQKEVFLYDNLNRLTNWRVYQNGSTVPVGDNSLIYDAFGNIEKKSDLGNFLMIYGVTGKPHALDSIIGEPVAISSQNLYVTYTDFKKIKTFTEGNKFYILTYGIDDQRSKSEYKINGVTQKTKYYLGDYEEETDNLGNTKKIHYLSGGAILINTNGVETLYYGYNDYQGNLIALANEAGTVVERYAYDPWGKRRNPENWAQDDTRTGWIVDRGYTMHEHLDAYGIINMNGRVYDPLTAMFFSPDPFIQSPEDWLNYNRYSYVLNNPLKYTDPSGEFLIPAITGLLIYSGIAYLSSARDNNWNWDFRSWNNNSITAGYSTNGGGFFVGFSFDGNSYANIGAGYNGLTVGSTNNGVTTMEPVVQVAVQATKQWLTDQYNYFTDWDALSRDLTDWDAWQNAMPVWGSFKQSGEALDRGEFLNAGTLFVYGTAEVFSFGFASQYTTSAKAAMSLPKQQIVTTANKGVNVVAKGVAKGGMQSLTKAEMATIKGAGTSNNLYFNTPRQALRQAKRDLGIPTSQSHITHLNNVRTDRLGGIGSDLIFDGGKTIQWHKSGHLFPSNPIPAHFNIHPVSKFHYIYGL